MATFVVETYLSARSEVEPEATIARAIEAAAELVASGQPVRYLRSIFIPDDETCLLLFEAASSDALTALTERAGIDPDRIALADDRER